MADTPEDEVVKSEREILQAGSAFRTLLKSADWKVYEQLIRRCIEAREKLAIVPLAEQVEGDLMAKVVAQESVKGALIGLRLALSLPADMVQAADDILRSRSRKDEKDANL